MILEQETFREFGYYPDELKPQSNKKILAACDDCGKVRAIKKSCYRSLCASCVKKGRIPWNKDKHLTEDHRRKIGEAGKGRTPWNIGKPCSEEAKKKNSEAHKGQVPWNIGLKGFMAGENNPNYGKHHSEETKKKQSEANKGRIPWNKDKPPSEETRREISDANKGRIPWNKGFKGYNAGDKNPMFGRTGESAPMFGKHPSEETKQKNREARKLIKFPKHHTKPERIWQEIVIDKHSLPFRYTGDSSFWIGGKPAINPDFIHLTKKIVVEIFSYWHDPLRRNGKVRYAATLEGRKRILKKYGWKMIVFWDIDLLREDAEEYVLHVLRENKII